MRPHAEDLTMGFERIACIVPFRNEARYLPDVLATLAAQTIDRARLYVIGVDSGSTDGSDVIFQHWLSTAPVGGGELTRATVASIPAALNAGIARAAREDLIVRLDAHTLYEPAYVATLVATLDALPPDVWCVGGAPMPHAAIVPYSQALVTAMYGNPIALGPADFRRAHSEPAEVSTVYLGAWRPGVLQRLGGFDECWMANEDCELSERIRDNGGRIYRVPVHLSVIVTRGALATLRQRARYGFWRAQTFKRYPGAIRARHILPPVVLAGGLALLATRRRALLLPLYVAYALATVSGRPRGEPPTVTAGTLVFFPLLQASYALGLMVGIIVSPAQLRGGAHGQSQYER